VRNSSPKSFELAVVEARKHEINQTCDQVAYSSMHVHNDKLPSTPSINITEQVLSSLFKNMNFDNRYMGVIIWKTPVRRQFRFHVIYISNNNLANPIEIPLRSHRAQILIHQDLEVGRLMGVLFAIIVEKWDITSLHVGKNKVMRINLVISIVISTLIIDILINR